MDGTVNRVHMGKGNDLESSRHLVKRPGKSHVKDRQLESALSSLILQRREGQLGLVYLNKSL
jgi:hypothetical protein